MERSEVPEEENRRSPRAKGAKRASTKEPSVDERVYDSPSTDTRVALTLETAVPVTPRERE